MLVHSGHGNEVIHVVMTERQAKQRRENPKKSTRVTLNVYSPEAYSELHVQRERYFQLAVDPHLAISMMIRALRQVPDQTIRDWLNEGESDWIP